MCVQERHLADSGAMSPPIAFCAVSIRICVVSKVVLHFPVYYYIDLKNLKTKKKNQKLFKTTEPVALSNAV